jgi:hypothetical protein
VTSELPDTAPMRGGIQSQIKGVKTKELPGTVPMDQETLHQARTTCGREVGAQNPDRTGRTSSATDAEIMAIWQESVARSHLRPQGDQRVIVDPTDREVQTPARGPVEVPVATEEDIATTGSQSDVYLLGRLTHTPKRVA